jgi:hypothetical protein
MEAADETNITDIELLPNGRICVFGTSPEVLELLDELQAGLDENLHRRVAVSRRPPAVAGPLNKVRPDNA